MGYFRESVMLDCQLSRSCVYRLKPLVRALIVTTFFLVLSGCSGSAGMLGRLSLGSQSDSTPDDSNVSPVHIETEDAVPEKAGDTANPEPALTNPGQ